MSLIPQFIGAIIFTVIQALVFLFVLVATPLPMIRMYTTVLPKKEVDDCTDSANKSGRCDLLFQRTAMCYTAWGLTTKCNGSTYAARGTAAFMCAKRTATANGAAAFAIISIFTTLVALIFGILMIVRVSCIVAIPLVFVIISVITILISWACVAGVMTVEMCGDDTFPDYTPDGDYGAGFGLMVTAWCLQVINLIFLCILAFA